MSNPSAPPPPPPAPWVEPASPVRKRHPWRNLLIVLAVLVLVTLIIVGVTGLTIFLTQALGGRAPDQPLVTGEAASPHAATPLECPDVCFTDDSVEDAIALETTFARLGTRDATFPAGTYDPVSAGDLYRRDAAGWESYNGTPDSCFFGPTSSPYGASLDPANGEVEDLVHFVGTHENVTRTNLVDQSVRVFADSATAVAFMEELSAQIADCPVIEIGPPGDRYTAEITAAPALDVDDSIAAIGWVRTGDPGPRWRSYTMDLQRSNLVVRMRLLTDGSLTEEEFRAFAVDYGEQLAGLEAPEGPMP